jgi:hypothetical protein
MSDLKFWILNGIGIAAIVFIGVVMILMVNDVPPTIDFSTYQLPTK